MIERFNNNKDSTLFQKRKSINETNQSSALIGYSASKIKVSTPMRGMSHSAMKIRDDRSQGSFIGKGSNYANSNQKLNQSQIISCFGKY